MPNFTFDVDADGESEIRHDLGSYEEYGSPFLCR